MLSLDECQTSSLLNVGVPTKNNDQVLYWVVPPSEDASPPSEDANPSYTPGNTNESPAGKWTMLVYQRVYTYIYIYIYMIYDIWVIYVRVCTRTNTIFLMGFI